MCLHIYQRDDQGQFMFRITFLVSKIYMYEVIVATLHIVPMLDFEVHSVQ